jgi:3-methyladenine DNA glycosylase/8-oxoguanine DNA glycosylase
VWSRRGRRWARRGWRGASDAAYAPRIAFTLHPHGPFSLAAAAAFAEGFPATDARRDRGELAFAFSLEADWQAVGVRLAQRDGAVHGHAAASGALEARVRDAVEAILSLDVDGGGWPAVGERDPVIAAAQAQLPGLRPVLFWSPYEAAAWTIIGQRIRMSQAAAVKQRLAEDHGETVELDGLRLPVFPSPERLAALPSGVRGLNARKEEQLRALGRAALEGRLDRGRLRGLGREAADDDLRELPGIGPFSAELVWIRGVGDPDALPRNERRICAIVRDRYGEDAGLEDVAEAWRPYRAWAALALRASLAAA